MSADGVQTHARSERVGYLAKRRNVTLLKSIGWGTTLVCIRGPHSFPARGHILGKSSALITDDGFSIERTFI